MSKIITNEIIGKRFGHLVIIDNLGVQDNGRTLVRAKCDCGTIIDVYWFLIQKGKQDCGTRCKLRKPDFVNKQFTYLTVIGSTYNSKHRFEWICRCKCGTIINVDHYSLIHGRTKSCGCYWAEVTKQKSTRHNLSHSKIYSVYRGIKQRCLNPKSAEYKNYGARNILICNEWLGECGFINFYNWAKGNGYKEGLTIERVDVNGGYNPDNCKWIPSKAQAYNKTTSKIIDYKGVSKPLVLWCKELNLPYKKILRRFDLGWSAEKAFETP